MQIIKVPEDNCKDTLTGSNISFKILNNDVKKILELFCELFILCNKCKIGDHPFMSGEDADPLYSEISRNYKLGDGKLSETTQLVLPLSQAEADKFNAFDGTPYEKLVRNAVNQLVSVRERAFDGIKVNTIFLSDFSKAYTYTPNVRCVSKSGMYKCICQINTSKGPLSAEYWEEYGWREQINSRNSNKLSFVNRCIEFDPFVIIDGEINNTDLNVNQVPSIVYLDTTGRFFSKKPEGSYMLDLRNVTVPYCFYDYDKLYKGVIEEMYLSILNLRCSQSLCCEKLIRPDVYYTSGLLASLYTDTYLEEICKEARLDRDYYKWKVSSDGSNIIYDKHLVRLGILIEVDHLNSLDSTIFSNCNMSPLVIRDEGMKAYRALVRTHIADGMDESVIATKSILTSINHNNVKRELKMSMSNLEYLVYLIGCYQRYLLMIAMHSIGYTHDRSLHFDIRFILALPQFLINNLKVRYNNATVFKGRHIKVNGQRVEINGIIEKIGVYDEASLYSLWIKYSSASLSGGRVSYEKVKISVADTSKGGNIEVEDTLPEFIIKSIMSIYPEVTKRLGPSLEMWTRVNFRTVLEVLTNVNDTNHMYLCNEMMKYYMFFFLGEAVLEKEV